MNAACAQTGGPENAAQNTNGGETVAAKQLVPEIPVIKLLNEQFPVEQWTFYSGKKDASLGETWIIQSPTEGEDAILVCTGQPNGYIRTTRRYRNFELKLEWRFPKDPNGNSGILLYTNGEDRLWPMSLQVQLQQPMAGTAFPGGGAKSRNELRNVPALSRPLNQWNHCTITSVEGNVTVTVNNHTIGTVSGCEPNEGSIALQSEGSEIHFRNITLRPLADMEVSRRIRKRQKRHPDRLQFVIAP